MNDKIWRHLDRLETFLTHKLFAVGEVDVTPGSIGIFCLTVAFALLVGRAARKAILRLLLHRAQAGSEGSAYAVGRLTQYIIIAAGTLIGLETVGISLSTLAALGAVFTVGLGFGLQDITQNFVSGLVLLFERPISKGDVVIVDGTFGVVDEISFRATRVMTFDSIALIVPNNRLVSDIVENRSEPTRTYRVRIDVRVAYGTDSRIVEETLLRVGCEHERVLQDPSPSVFFVDFAESGLAFQLCVWLDDPMVALATASDLRHAMVRAFGEQGIVIPVPRREVSFADPTSVDRLSLARSASPS